MADAGDIVLGELGIRAINSLLGDPQVERDRAAMGWELAKHQLENGIPLTGPDSLLNQKQLEKVYGPELAGMLIGYQTTDAFKQKVSERQFQQQNQALQQMIQQGAGQILQAPGFNYVPPAGMYPDNQESFDPNIHYAQPPMLDAGQVQQQTDQGGHLWQPPGDPQLALAPEAMAEDAGASLRQGAPTPEEVARRFERISPTLQAVIFNPELGALSQRRMSDNFQKFLTESELASRKYISDAGERNANWRTALNAAVSILPHLDGANATTMQPLMRLMQGRSTPEDEQALGKLGFTNPNSIRQNIAAAAAAKGTVDAWTKYVRSVAKDKKQQKAIAGVGSGELNKSGAYQIATALAGIEGVSQGHIMQTLQMSTWFAPDGTVATYDALPQETQGEILNTMVEVIGGSQAPDTYAGPQLPMDAAVASVASKYLGQQGRGVAPGQLAAAQAPTAPPTPGYMTQQGASPVPTPGASGYSVNPYTGQPGAYIVEGAGRPAVMGRPRPPGANGWAGNSGRGW